MTKSRAYRWAQNFQRRRSARSQEMDARRNARMTFGEDLGTKDYSKWKGHPGRYDIEGIDTAPKSKGQRKTNPQLETRERQVPEGTPRVRRGFFDGMVRRRSAYADLPWDSDPEVAQALAGQDLTPQIVSAYQSEVDRELNREFFGDMMGADRFDSKSRRKRNE